MYVLKHELRLKRYKYVMYWNMNYTSKEIQILTQGAVNRKTSLKLYVGWVYSCTWQSMYRDNGFLLTLCF